MLTCKECGESFKNKSALGGHVVNTHRAASPGTVSTTASISEETNKPGAPDEQRASSQANEGSKAAPPPPGEAGSVSTAEEESKAAQIRSLLKQGYTFEQLTNDLGFAESTVRQELVKLIPPIRSPKEEPAEETRVIKLGRYEVIPPEVSLQSFRLPDGDYKRGFVDGIGVLLLAARYNQELATVQSQMLLPTIDMLKAMRDEERIAAERARGEGTTIAQEAAQRVAGQVMNALEPRLARLEEKKPDIATVPNPFAGMMARAMEPMLMQLMGQVGKTLGGMSLGVPGTATQPGQPAGQGVGFQQMTDEERKSVFGG